MVTCSDVIVFKFSFTLPIINSFKAVNIYFYAMMGEKRGEPSIETVDKKT